MLNIDLSRIYALLEGICDAVRDLSLTEAPTNTRPPTARGEWKLSCRAIAIATGILLVILGIQTVLRNSSEWQDVYVAAGREMMAGKDIFNAGFGYAYPPFVALVAAPLNLMPAWLSKLLWFAGSAIGLVVMVTASWRLAGGVPLNRTALLAKDEFFSLLCGVAINLGFFLNAFAHQQTDVIVGGLVMAGALLLSAQHDLRGGSLIGLAAAFKATPLLWSPYLLSRRRWTSAAAVMIVAIAVNLLPDAVVPSARGGWWLGMWFNDFILTTQAFDAPLGLWASAIEYNQSLGGTLQRLINSKLVFDPMIAFVPRPILGPVPLKVIAYSSFILLVTVSMVAANRARRGAPFAVGLPNRESYEFSLVLILMLLLSPMSGRPHFGILILPTFCLVRFTAAVGDRLTTFILAAVALLVSPPYRYLVPANIHGALLWAGATTFATLLLWIGCIRVLWRGADSRAFIYARN